MNEPDLPPSAELVSQPDNVITKVLAALCALCVVVLGSAGLAWDARAKAIKAQASADEVLGVAESLTRVVTEAYRTSALAYKPTFEEARVAYTAAAEAKLKETNDTIRALNLATEKLANLGKGGPGWGITAEKLKEICAEAQREAQAEREAEEKAAGGQ